MATVKQTLDTYYTMVFVSYRTTIFGLAAGALNLYANGMKPREVGLSVALTVLGMLAKDGNVTMSASGRTPKAITVQMPPEHQDQEPLLPLPSRDNRSNSN